MEFGPAGTAQNTAATWQTITWQKTDFGWYKCIVDAGIHKELNKSSFRWSLRDYNGLFVLAGTAWKEGRNCS
jgi:hypothetical protein